jgi:hypothetical protein
MMINFWEDCRSSQGVLMRAIFLCGLVVQICLSGVSALADDSGSCSVPAGFCPIPATPAGTPCYCNTQFGALNGKVAAPGAPLPANVLATARASENKPITVQIFASGVTKGSLETWISSLGSSVSVIYTQSKYMNALRDDPLTAVFYTTDVPESVVRIFVLSLLENGVEVKSIEPYDVNVNEGRPPLHSVLQIGRSTRNRNLQVLTEVNAASAALPVLGVAKAP